MRTLVTFAFLMSFLFFGGAGFILRDKSADEQADH